MTKIFFIAALSEAEKHHALGFVGMGVALIAIVALLMLVRIRNGK